MSDTFKMWSIATPQGIKRFDGAARLYANKWDAENFCAGLEGYFPVEVEVEVRMPKVTKYLCGYIDTRGRMRHLGDSPKSSDKHDAKRFLSPAEAYAFAREKLTENRNVCIQEAEEEA